MLMRPFARITTSSITGWICQSQEGQLALKREQSRQDSRRVGVPIEEVAQI